MKLSFKMAFALALGLASSGDLFANCESKTDYWPYDYTTGGEDINVEFFADLHLERDCITLRSEIHAGAIADLYGITLDAVDAVAGAQLLNRNVFAVDAKIAVLGMVVHEFNRQELAEIGYRDSFNFPIQLADHETFMVGPVPVGVDYGVVGEAGLDYDATLQVGAAHVGARPFVESNVFAAAGIDVGFASVKAYGDVILLNNTLNGEMSVAIDQVNFDNIIFNAHAENEVEALNGKISMLAEAKIMGFNRTYSRDLFAWDGYYRDDEVFNVELDFPIIQ